jgi:purine nucleoside phosphorylase
MTGMPEAVLARELELCYASLCVIVNPAAGVGEERIDGAAIRAASDVGGRAFSAVVDSLAARLREGLV